MNLDSFDDLALRAEHPPPAIYTAVLRARHKLTRERPGEASTVDMGIEAWNGMTEAERREALPLILGCYVDTQYEQERRQKLQSDAANPATTYLDPGDVSELWDSVHCAEVDPVEADRWPLVRVLWELELLQHRLAMRDRKE